MNVFYFHFCRDGQLQRDEVGLRLADTEAAYLQAVAAVPAMAAELLSEGVDPARCEFEIADQAGRALFSVHFSDLVRPSRSELRLKECAREEALAGLQESNRVANEAKRAIGEAIVQAHAALAESHSLLAILSRYGGDGRQPPQLTNPG